MKQELNAAKEASKDPLDKTKKDKKEPIKKEIPLPQPKQVKKVKEVTVDPEYMKQFMSQKITRYLF